MTDSQNQTTQTNQKVENLEVEKTETLIIQKEKPTKRRAPYKSDQQAASGHMPDPEVDDNALDMAQRAGLYTEAGEEDPKELNVAKQVDQAEKSRRQK